jgi:pyruvate dehydrogenase (quinone)
LARTGRRSFCRIRPEQLGRRTGIDLGVVGDVKATLKALLPLIEPNGDSTHLLRAQRHYAKSRQELDQLASASRGKSFIHPQQVAKAISNRAATDAIFTCDVGLPTVWAARYLDMNGRRRLLGSFWHGSMANAMAQAIGAQKAFPSRQMVSALGQKQTLSRVEPMSALPPKADIGTQPLNVRFVPRADSCAATKCPTIMGR